MDYIRGYELLKGWNIGGRDRLLERNHCTHVLLPGIVIGE